jgi:hypothetical protein
MPVSIHRAVIVGGVRGFPTVFKVNERLARRHVERLHTILTSSAYFSGTAIILFATPSRRIQRDSEYAGCRSFCICEVRVKRENWFCTWPMAPNLGQTASWLAPQIRPPRPRSVTGPLLKNSSLRRAAAIIRLDCSIIPQGSEKFHRHVHSFLLHGSPVALFRVSRSRPPLPQLPQGGEGRVVITGWTRGARVE